MANWAAIGIVAAAEVATFFTATVKAFTAEARVVREHDSDIRAAIAGYEAGKLLPALTQLVSHVVQIRRSEEPIADALARADITNSLGIAVEASIRSQAPRSIERDLIRTYTALGWSLLAAQVAGPGALYNVLTDGYNLPQQMVIVFIVIFVLSVISAAAWAIVVRQRETALARVIRDGKDAAA